MNNYPKFDPDYESFDNVSIKCDVLSPDEFINKNATKYKPNSFLSIFHLNIRSCRSNFANLQLFLQTLLIPFTIIILSETWLSEDSDFLFEIDGYKSISLNRNNHGGGIKLYVLEAFEIVLLNHFSFIGDLYECLTCELEISSKKFTVCSVYRPPQSNIFRFIDKFNSEVLSRLSNKSKTIIVGDFNINLLNPLSLSSINSFISLMLSFNYISCITCPTKYNPLNPITKYSLIDHIWINFSHDDITSGIIYEEISDHFPIFTILKTEIIHNHITNKSRIFNETNFGKFKNSFNSLDFTNVFISPNANDAYGVLHNLLFKTYNLSFPIKNNKRKPNQNLAWITPELKFCMKKKFKLLKLYRQNLITKESYNQYKNTLTSAIKQSKILYFMKKSMNLNNDVKQTWNFINNILNKNKKESINYINDDNGIPLKGVSMSNYFNSYFTSIIPNLIANTPLQNNLTQKPFQNIPFNNETFFFLPVVPFEIQLLIMKLPNKSCHIDDIPIDVLKSISFPLSIILAYIINKCIEDGIYPSLLKQARVIPIYKSGNKSEVNNYRPISTLKTINKIFEKIIYSRMTSFIYNHKLISNKQHGFKKNSSTSLAMFNLLSGIVSSLSSKEYCICLFLDLKKAFDSVNHSILCEKISRMGFRGNILELIKSYLLDRYQYVDINGFCSSNKRSQYGVPQGSVLGPILFNLFFNDISFLDCDSIVMFADDCVFKIKDSSFERLIFRLNQFLNKLNTWLCSNELFPNTRKTFLMLFTNKPIYILPDIYFQNDILTWVDNIKYLGVVIDSKLNFNLQLDMIRNKVSRGTGIIYSLRSYLPQSLLVKLYHGLIYPYLTQNIIIWGGVSVNKLRPIQVQMNQALRHILNVKFDNFHRPLQSTDSMFKKLGLLKIRHIYEYFILKFMHTCIYGHNYDIFVNHLLPLLPNHTYETRNIKINYPHIKLEIERSMPIYNMIKFFNTFPYDLIKLQSEFSLRKNFKNYALSRY